jgi:D-alanyl-D-alanine endopeptidase (penicillin-binding protein 7)
MTQPHRRVSGTATAGLVLALLCTGVALPATASGTLKPADFSARKAAVHGKARSHHRAAPLHGRKPVPERQDARRDLPEGLALRSNAAIVVDETAHEVLADRNADQIQPIASITKLMTAVVVLQQGYPLDELMQIDDADVDLLRHTHSLLRVGSHYTRRDLLLLALMSSENRAAAALGRSAPEGRDAFVGLMNSTAQMLGMVHTHFEDTSGLNGNNASSARDLSILVRFAANLPLIHEFTTTPEARVLSAENRGYVFRNTNLLVRQGNWDVVVSKTGFINESGQCLVMQARIDGKLTTMVLLDSHGHLGRISDAQQVRRWLEARAAAQSRVGALAPRENPTRRPRNG